MTDKEKIKSLIKYYGGTQDAFAEIIGTSKATIASWLNRGNLTANAIHKILKHCEGVSEEWLLEDKLPKTPHHKEQTKNRNTKKNTKQINNTKPNFYKEIPVSAGQVMWAEQVPERPTDTIYFPGCKADFFFPIHGISMEPYILEGDIIGVTRSDDLENLNPHSIYMIIGKDGLRAIKMLEQDGNELICHSKNPNIADFRIPLDSVIHIYKLVFSARLY